MPFTFLNGIFSLALAAVGVPILIHLLNRRRSKRESFSSLEFLEEVTRRQRRRIRLRQWLLLALRTLAVALVVLAMMRPAIRSGLPGGAGETTATVVFDTSYSMAASTAEGSSREIAEARLRELGSLFSSGDRIQLVFPDGTATRAFDGPVQDFDRVRTAAERRGLDYQPADLRAAIESAGRDLSDSPALNREIYVLSDFQRTDWALDDLDESSLAVSDETRVYLVPVRSASLPNVAIANASFVEASLRSGGSGAVRVTLANQSNDTISAHPVRVFDGDDVVADGTMAVPANDVATRDLPLSRAPEPNAVLEVRIDEDALAVDDVAWVTAGERQTIRVLLVHGGAVSTASAEPFLKLALDPPGESGERYFTVNEISLRDLPVETDFDYDVFVMNNVERLSEGVAERLRLAHRDGAGVLFILGDRVDLRYYNTSVLPGLLDVTLEGAVSGNGNHFTLRPEVAGHPIFDGFRVAFGEDLSQARFTKLVNTDVGPDARVLAKLGNYPGLVESDRVLLLATAADLRWGNFPTGGSFLPFLHQAMLDLASAAVGDRQPIAGEPIETEFPLHRVVGDVTCTTPNEAALSLEPSAQAGRVTVRTEPAPVPGVYRFDSGGETIGQVAVHLDADEGRLDIVDAEAVAERLEGNVRVLDGEEPLARRVLEDRQGRELWPLLILLALGCLVAESIVGRMRLA